MHTYIQKERERERKRERDGEREREREKETNPELYLAAYYLSRSLSLDMHV